MKDKKDNEVQVGDCVFFGERAGNQGSRGVCKVGRITSIDRYIHVSNSYTGLTSSSVIKCTEKFADMYESGEIFQI